MERTSKATGRPTRHETMRLDPQGRRILPEADESDGGDGEAAEEEELSSRSRRRRRIDDVTDNDDDNEDHGGDELEDRQTAR